MRCLPPGSRSSSTRGVGVLAELRVYPHVASSTCHSSEFGVIVYSLHCFKGHAFEGWFGSIAAFDEQQAAGKLLCPICNSRKVSKAPMAPALSSAVGEKKRRGASVPVQSPAAPAAPVPTAAPAMPEELRKMRQFITGLRKYVEQNADYVGRKFPEEARKIHYGESEERHIYGEASLEEAADLVEEGIDVAPLPPDMNEAN